MIGNIKFNVKDYFALCVVVIFLLFSYSITGVNPIIVIFCQLLLVAVFTFFLKWPNVPLVLSIGLIALIISKTIYVFTLNPLLSSLSDEIKYYDQMIIYKGNLINFFSYVLSEIKMQIRISAIPAYGVMYIPFYSLLSYDDSIFIVVFNSIILIFLVNVVYRIYQKHFMWQLDESKRLPFQRLIILFLFISPVFMYWTSTFSKDVPSIFIAFLALSLLLNKRYFLFLIMLIYGTMLRPYTIVLVIGYYLIIKKQLKIALIGVILSFLAVFWFIGISGVLNIFYSVGYLLLAPFPFDIGNWISYPLIVPEVIFLFVMFILSGHVYINNRETRTFYKLCLCFLLIYACAQVLNGYMFVSGREWEYTVGQVGDNLNRKKLPLIILYYTVTSYTWVHFRSKKLNQSKSKGNIVQS